MARNKKKRSEAKKIRSRFAHSNSLDKVIYPLAGLSNKTIKFVICIFLVVMTFAVYSQIQDHEFINFDDHIYITENLHVKTGLTSESVKWAFTTFHAGMWFPMTWLSHILDYQLYGLHPKGYLLTNLFFHITNALLLFIVLLRMTGALWQTSFVAVMFALHPLNVESVAWVAERKNVLSTLFWLLTIWAYIRYVQKTNVTRYCLVVLFFTCGLMSKAMLVTLPFVLLLLDYWPMGRFKFGNKNEPDLPEYIEHKAPLQRLIWEKVPLIALAIGSIIMTVMAHGDTLQSLEAYPLQGRVINALVSYLLYIQKMVWPSGMSIFYPHPGNALPVWQGIGSAILLVFVTIGAIGMSRRAPYLLVGWLWYLGTLVPVIGIVLSGWQAMADRFAYVPLIGIFIMVAWGLPQFMARWRYKEKTLSISAGIIILTLMLITWVQVSHWKNSITIFKHAVSMADNKYPGLARTHSNLGLALQKEGRLNEAVTQFKTAIKINPSDPEAYINIGNILSGLNTDEAIDYYKEAIRIRPNYALAYNNLGKALVQKGELKKGVGYYKEAIKIKPNFAPAYYNLGNFLLAEQKETEEAISNYKMAIKFKPDFAEAHNNLGNALVQKGKMKEAIVHYRETLRLKPDLISVQKNLKMTILRAEVMEN